jgi:SET domain-containing protein
MMSVQHAHKASPEGAQQQQQQQEDACREPAGDEPISIDATFVGNVSRFINHRCGPSANCVAQAVCRGGARCSSRGPRLRLGARLPGAQSQPPLTGAPPPWARHAGPETADTSMPVVIITARAIAKGEELNFDYNPHQEAQCASAACYLLAGSCSGARRAVELARARPAADPASRGQSQRAGK